MRLQESASYSLLGNRDSYVQHKPEQAQGYARNGKIGSYINLDPAVYADLQYIAEEEGRPVATVGRRLLTQAIKAYMEKYHSMEIDNL